MDMMTCSRLQGKSESLWRTWSYTLCIGLLGVAPAYGQISFDQAPADLGWDTLQPGLAVAELTTRAGRVGFDVRVVVARIDPKRFRFELVQKTRANGMTGAWNVGAAPPHAALAFNAGQFKETGPWGWLLLRGEERRNPGIGPLSIGIAFDTSGALRWIPYQQLERARRDRSLVYAFQSYPVLIYDSVVPRRAHRGIDRTHRDARLILAEDSRGQLLVVLTRYDALGDLTARVPIGLTLPESVTLMRALGARHAVMLDGGVSAQMVARNALGASRVWKGLRDVPLALIALPRVD